MRVIREDVLAYLVEHPMPNHPPLLRALSRDAMVFAYHRGEPHLVQTRFRRILYTVRLPFRASEYLGLALYRLRTKLNAARVPVLPAILNAICALVWGIRIGNYVVIQGGIYVPHGQIILDGLVAIDPGCVLCPWITVGLVQGDVGGPRLEEGVFVGTGAKILGPVRIGTGARIGANAVIVEDVPAWHTAVGVPARSMTQLKEGWAERPKANSSREDSSCEPS